MTTKIPVELSSTPGIVDGSNATAITIDSSERVGVGTASPAQTLHTSGTGVQRIQIDATDNNAAGAGLYMKVLNSGSLVGNATIRVDNVGNIDFFNGTSSESEKMTIQSDGRVGIGATPSDYWGTANGLVVRESDNSTGITIATSTSNTGQIYFADGTSGDARYRGWLTYAHGTDTMSLATAAATKVTINSSGNVGIGTSSPTNVLDLGAATMGRGLTFTNYSNLISEYSNASLWLASNFYPNAGASGYKTGATGNFGAAGIRVHGTGGGSQSGILQFYTDANSNKTADAAFTPTERMRILADGNVLVGKTVANSATVGFEARADGRLFSTAANSYSAYFNRTSSHGSLVIYAKDDVTVGSISTNANSLPSDRNFKKDIVDLNIGLDLVTKLKPVSYNYKIDDDDCPKMFGLIAQDLEQSLEEVNVEKNSVQLLQHKPKEDKKESDYSLDYLKLTPILIKAIQEQQEQIEQLKTEIQTLKGE